MSIPLDKYFIQLFSDMCYSIRENLLFTATLEAKYMIRTIQRLKRLERRTEERKYFDLAG